MEANIVVPSKTRSESPEPLVRGSRSLVLDRLQLALATTTGLVETAKQNMEFSLPGRHALARDDKDSNVLVDQPPRVGHLSVLATDTNDVYYGSDTATSENSTDNGNTDDEYHSTPGTSQLRTPNVSSLGSISPSSSPYRQASQASQERSPAESFLLDVGLGNDPQRHEHLDIDEPDRSPETPCDIQALAAARAPILGRGVPDIGRRYERYLEPPLTVTRKRKPKRKGKNALNQQIYNALQETQGSGKLFLPNGQLSKILTEQAVLEELESSLSRYRISELKEYTEIICHGTRPLEGDDREPEQYLKIFALLVWIGYSKYFPLFFKEGISDDTLPIELQRGNGRVDLKIRRRDTSTPNDFSEEYLRCVDGWPPGRKEILWKEQWSFLAPFLEKGGYNNVPHYDLGDEEILPFIGRSEVGFGGSSRVFVTKIHPDHHSFRDSVSSSRLHAVKKLISKDEIEDSEAVFRNEVDILKKFRGHGEHQHIITLLVTYKQFNAFHLVFYLADSNLYDYWVNKNPQPAMNYNNILWVIQQCQGLADGLSKLHYHETFVQGNGEDQEPGRRISKYGRHKDIKPQNILWYSSSDGNQGTLKLSDFGASDLKSSASRSNSGGKAPETFTYRPPERELKFSPIRQSADIWSLGCVFLEFITWALGGQELWYSFGQARCSSEDTTTGADGIGEDIFYTVKFERCVENRIISTVMVKEAVVKQFDILHSNDRCTEVFHAFLNMIQLDMLVLEAENLGQRRESAQQIANKLEALHDRCLRDSDFATKPRPWTREHLNRVVAAITVNLPAAKEHRFNILPRGVTDHSGLTLAARTKRTGASDTS